MRIDCHCGSGASEAHPKTVLATCLPHVCHVLAPQVSEPEEVTSCGALAFYDKAADRVSLQQTNASSRGASCSRPVPARLMASRRRRFEGCTRIGDCTRALPSRASSCRLPGAHPPPASLARASRSLPRTPPSCARRAAARGAAPPRTTLSCGAWVGGQRGLQTRAAWAGCASEVAVA